MSAISNCLNPLPPGKLHLGGRMGGSLRRSIDNRLNKVNYRHLVDPFRFRNETDGRWRCEYWGKIVRSAILSWRGEPDPALLRHIDDTVGDLLSTQTADGCISSYPYEKQTEDWDIWGRKYVLLGLIRYYQEIEADERVRTAIVRHLDYIMTQIGPQAKNILECGWHTGMAPSSLLEPVVLVARITGEKRFLDFARWIAGQGGSSQHNIFTAILEGVPPYQLGNGKSYEMMSCFEGLAELYRETGNPACFNAVLAFYRAVRDQEILITGIGGLRDECGEYWDNGRIKQTGCNAGTFGETCVTTTWLKFCSQVLRLTGDATVVDEMERTLYNGVLGAMVPDGSWWMHGNPTPLAGPSVKVRAGDQLPGFGEDCCLAQGPTALAFAPWLAVMTGPEGPVINLYETAEATVGDIGIRITGDFPRSGKIGICITPASARRFPVRLRIPAWSAATQAVVNRSEVYDAIPGTWLRIDRAWNPGDEIALEFPMPIRVIADCSGGNRIALQRGPIVLAQDSRLGPVDCPVGLAAGRVSVSAREIVPPDGIYQAYKLPDGTAVCDYASAGNEFSNTNQLCVWMKPQDEKNSGPQNQK